MDASLIVSKLEKQYLGKTIVKLPEQNPKEIICEVEPSSAHSEWSLAVAFIDESVPHFHKVSVEKYEVLNGTLTLFVEGESHVLGKGGTFTVEPGMVHWAKGNATEVKVYSEPGWKLEAHILVED